jgi:hypothetical protein
MAEKSHEDAPLTLRDDIIRGAQSIGAEIGETASFVYHAHKMRRLPTFKLGKVICARRSRLLLHIEEMESS